ncbi:hypothetical protein CYMTET_4438 [Cymbomonas tetramitiformis]|uniref:Uncharacterized protein n=1 Tax=Cymbomonas tetramitiformis TaxID=36881 RepID=A0AAE0H156_9CHLO|nr:hypothetical protein CYMTET_4438 [Cymbomonas tetramitiformis]
MMLSSSRGADSAGSPECWTLFSTNEYGKANKVPQENVPARVSDKVTALWGAGLPLNSPREEYIFDSAARIVHMRDSNRRV